MKSSELRYLRLAAEEGEARLERLKKAKSYVMHAFKITYGPMMLNPDQLRSYERCLECIEEALDEMTYEERTDWERLIVEYESSARICHEIQESTITLGGNNA